MRTTSKAQEMLNITYPAYILAQADERDFLPTLPDLSKEELFSVAQTYDAMLESGEHPRPSTAKIKLIKAITRVIRERVTFTRQKYQEALAVCNAESISLPSVPPAQQ